MPRTEGCFMCQDPMFTDMASQHPQKIAELDVSTAILNRDLQFFRGTTILVFQDHMTELHGLSTELQHRYVDDANRMAEALIKTFPGVKLNHGLFGNAMPHLHWHIIIRRATDPDPKSTIWESEFPIVEQSQEELQITVAEIRRNL